MLTREEIFEFGIFGRGVRELSKKDVTDALKYDYVETLSESELNEFRKALNTSSDVPRKTYTKKKAIKEEDYVRMKITDWQLYLFGSSKMLQSKVYGILVDCLLKKKEMTTAEGREVTGVDPKTMHYVCKRLCGMGIIEERKEASGNVIFLLPLRDRSKEEKEKKSVFCLERPPITPNLVQYNNVGLMEQIEMHIIEAAEGLGSKKLYELSGIKPKVGLKILQYVCSRKSEVFCAVSETEYKSRTLKFFSREKYAEIERKRLKSIVEGCKGRSELKEERRQAITSREKETAIKALVEKYGSFVLDNSIYEELCDMTGWAYSFDKKTILKAAIRAGLCVIKERGSSRSGIYRIEAESIDEEECNAERSLRERPDEKLARRMRLKFWKNQTFLAYDNGYRRRPCHGALQLYYYLKERHGIGKEFLLSMEDIGEMKVSLIYYLFQISKYQFRFSVEKAILECNSNFPKVLTKDAVDAMKYREYIGRLSGSFKKFLEQRVIPENLLATLKRLEEYGAVILRRYPIRVSLMAAPEILLEAVSREEERGYVPLVLREEFVKSILKADQARLYEASLEFIANCPDRAATRVLYSKVVEAFSDISKEKRCKERCRKKSAQPPLTIPEHLHDSYLKIKEALVEEAFSTKFIDSMSNEDAVLILRHMLKNKIISSFSLTVDPPAVALSGLFKKKYVFDVEFARNHTVVTKTYPGIYFRHIYKILKQLKRADIAAVLERVKFIEDFELEFFFRTFKDAFVIEEVDKYIFVSLANEKDPFEINLDEL